MKILIRFMSLIIISFVIGICLIYLINVNIMIDERDNATKISIESCQNIVKSKIIDEYLSLDNSLYEIYDDESYRKYFISSFDNLVTNKNLYDVKVNTNYEKGIISVIVHNKYSPFIKDKKVINIIEVSQ